MSPLAPRHAVVVLVLEQYILNSPETGLLWVGVHCTHERNASLVAPVCGLLQLGPQPWKAHRHRPLKGVENQVDAYHIVLLGVEGCLCQLSERVRCRRRHVFEAGTFVVQEHGEQRSCTRLEYLAPVAHAPAVGRIGDHTEVVEDDGSTALRLLARA
eukprot:4446388-Prymnesium_polylepis.2